MYALYTPVLRAPFPCHSKNILLIQKFLNLERGKPLRDKWQKIPTNTDVLITHGPPMNILDGTIDGENVGCYDLWEAVNRIKPKFHVFGHIHEGYGQIEKNGIEFINACICTERYKPVNTPIVFDL